MMDNSATYAGYYTKGYAVKGETYAELAEALGMDAATFEQTMNDWNASVEAQCDPAFGRLSFAKALDMATTYDSRITDVLSTKGTL